MKTKVCNKCGNEYPATADFFFKAKDRTDGLDGSCKECYMKARKVKKYGDGIFKRCKVCGKTLEIKSNFYLDKNSLDGYAMRCMQCTKHKYDNLDKSDSKKAKSEKIKEPKPKKKPLSDEELKAKNKQRHFNYYWKNKEKIIERRKIRKENGYKYSSEKEKKSKVVRNQKRRANLKNLPNTFTLEEWEYCKAYFNNKCCYCGEDAPLQQEHFIPVSKMGPFTADNILPSCGSCNVKKQDKDFFEWYPTEPFYSKENETKILKYLSEMTSMEQKSS
jgi:hypothetical protein